MTRTARHHPDAAASAPRAATARVAGHFGELVQGRLGSSGPVALVTLKCPELVTRVRYRPARGGRFSETADAAKAFGVAKKVLDRVTIPGWAGRLVIDRPAPPGVGAGSSTADILGTVRAVARAFGHRFSPTDEAAFCLRSEGAVDPLMHRGTVLFASRTARVLKRLPAPPPMRVTGLFAGPGRPTDPEDDDFPDMSAAFQLLETGLATRDLATIARAASVSAEANQARNPNPVWKDVLRIGAATGALGPVASHTGSAIGLIFRLGADTNRATHALEELNLGPALAF